jgi:hypothetical protein
VKSDRAGLREESSADGNRGYPGNNNPDEPTSVSLELRPFESQGDHPSSLIASCSSVTKTPEDSDETFAVTRGCGMNAL